MINKFGVPTDTTGDDRAPTIQPKFKNRFRVFFYNFGNQRLSLTGVGNQGVIATDQERLALMGNVVSFNKPNISFAQVPVSSFIGKGTVAGRPTWENLNITLRDDIKNAALKFIMRQTYLQQQKYMPHSSAFGRNFNFDIMLEIMDGRVGHTGLERWFFTGCSIVNGEFGDNSYESTTDFQRINLTMAFNNVYIFSPSRINFASAHQYNEQGGRSLGVSDLTGLNEVTNSVRDEIYGVINSATDSLVGVVDDAISGAVDATGSFINRTFGDQFDFLDRQVDNISGGINSAINSGTDALSGAVRNGTDSASRLFTGSSGSSGGGSSTGGFINEIDF